MGKGTEIAWVDNTFNPWWGCFKVSPACQNCYAETFSNRLGKKLWGAIADRQFATEKYWAQLRKWNAEAEKSGIRQTVFVSSMSDIMENHIDNAVDTKLDEARARLFNEIEATPFLTYLILTKRPEQLIDKLPFDWIAGQLPPNVWLGVTVESNKYLYRIDLLRNIGAVVKFVSAEPMLEPLDLSKHWDAIDWIIVGGESGVKARPMDVEGAKRLAREAEERGKAFFFKQLSQSGIKDKSFRDFDSFPRELQIRHFPI